MAEPSQLPQDLPRGSRDTSSAGAVCYLPRPRLSPPRKPRGGRGDPANQASQALFPPRKPRGGRHPASQALCIVRAQCDAGKRSCRTRTQTKAVGWGSQDWGPRTSLEKPSQTTGRSVTSGRDPHLGRSCQAGPKPSTEQEGPGTTTSSSMFQVCQTHLSQTAATVSCAALQISHVFYSVVWAPRGREEYGPGAGRQAVCC